MANDLPLFDRYLPLRSFPGDRSVVYLCADVVEHRPAALKAFRDELATGPNGQALVRGCADWLRIRPHPHLVAAREVRRDESSLAVVADYVEPLDGMPDASLRGLLLEPVPLGCACSFALGIARGMRHAVECLPGLVHGELTPENVLIGRDHRAKVSSFGLACLAGNGVPLPSRRFIAPECHSGHFDQRADIYSFGLILLQMLAGDTGIPMDDASLVEAAHRDGQPLQRAQAARLPAPLRPVIEACLHPSPEDRMGDWALVEGMLVSAWPGTLGIRAPLLPESDDAEREHRVLLGWANLAVADALWERVRVREALEAYEVALDIALDEGDQALEADALSRAGRVLYASGQLDRAATKLLRAMELKRDLRDLRGQATALVAIGDVCARQGNAEEALAGYFAAARLFAEQGDRRGSATARLHMAPVLDCVGRQSEAHHAADESRALFEEAGDLRGEGLAWSARARLLRGAGSLQDSLASSRMAVDRSRASGDKKNAARELSLQAQTLSAMQLVADAIDEYALAVRACEEADEAVLRADNLRALATLLLGTPGASARGRSCARLAAALYRTEGRDDLAREAEQLAERFED